MFSLRLAEVSDIPALHALIEASVLIEAKSAFWRSDPRFDG